MSVSEAGSDVEIEVEEINETPSVVDIFRAFSQVEDFVGFKTELLWSEPVAFLNFLQKNQLENPENATQKFFQTMKDPVVCAVRFMKDVFEMERVQEAQALDCLTMKDFQESTSRNSWNTFVELSSEHTSSSISFPLADVIALIEHMKGIRLTALLLEHNQKISKTLPTRGLNDYVKRSKTIKGIKVGKDPSLPYMSTSSQNMNTYTLSTTVPSAIPNANVRSWQESLYSGDNQGLFDLHSLSETNSGGLQQNITYYGKKEGDNDVSYTWPAEECSAFVTMTVHPYGATKEVLKKRTLKDVWTARSQTYKMCVGPKTPELMNLLYHWQAGCAKIAQPSTNANVVVKTTKKRVWSGY
jgi:hypothetical protein